MSGDKIKVQTDRWGSASKAMIVRQNWSLLEKLAGLVRKLLWTGISRTPKRIQKILNFSVLNIRTVDSAFEEWSAGCKERIHKSEDFGARVFRIAKASVIHNSRFNALFLGKQILIPSRREHGPWRLYFGKEPAIVAGVVGQHSNLLAIRMPPSRRSIDQFIYVGTRAPYNWYHWVANTLPAIHLANINGVPRTVPLLLPVDIQNVPQMVESLEIFREGRNIEWINPREEVQGALIYWAESPVYDSPPSISLSCRLPLTLDMEVMKSYSTTVIGKLGSNSGAKSTPSRVFLARNSDKSRLWNHKEVETLVNSLGFETIFLEELSFMDQVRIFRQASYMVGPTGAAFSNLVFGHPRLKGLRIVNSARHFENFFQNLATVAGAQVADFSLDDADYIDDPISRLATVMKELVASA